MREQAGTESRARRGAAAALVAWTAMAASCTSEGPPEIVQLPAANGQSGPTFDVRTCQHYAGFEIIERACVIDSNGSTYPMNSTFWHLPAAPPYAGFVEFAPGWVPLAQDLDTTSDNPGIRVFVQPTDLFTPCCADPNGFRPPVQAALMTDGGLLVTITDPLPVGDELSIGFFTGKLYADLAIPCTQREPCIAPEAGFGATVGIGAGPGQGPPPPPR